ncbi:hypothetical protein F7725_010159 [Dissostichus mawsoni]|uniref:Uncharacterized protein n=1 Tax=Dissostichus mawsoni TaxID=36200 RepID=A0A7J5XN63_DISMA|nr:hypothetical protein F7725_010159 [Dissostichus mawsoni]
MIDSQAFCPESASTAITLDTREPPCAALGTSSVMKEFPSGEGYSGRREGCPLSFTATIRFCFMLFRLRNVPLCPDLSAVETNSEKSRISGFDYMIRQPGVLSGVLFHAVRLRNVPLCPDLSAVETNSEKSRISGFDNMIGQPGVLSGVRVHRDHFGHQRASVCSFGDQLGHEGVALRAGWRRERAVRYLSLNNKVLFHAVRLRNVPLCPDLSAVETNSEKSRISGFDYMIRQPGVLSGVRVHRDHFGHQRASVCSFGDQLGHEGVALRGGVQYLRRVVIHIRHEHTDGHVAAERRRTVVSGHHVTLKLLNCSNQTTSQCGSPPCLR